MYTLFGETRSHTHNIFSWETSSISHFGGWSVGWMDGGELAKMPITSTVFNLVGPI